MIGRLVGMYKDGAITAEHLVAECVHMIDPHAPELVLSALPDEILRRMLQFARVYRPDGMATNYGILPAEDQVVAARKWIERRLGDGRGDTTDIPTADASH